MRKVLGLAALLAMTAPLLAAPALAAPVTAAAPAARQGITLPFAPPVGVPVRYDFSMVSMAGATLRQRIDTRDELLFSRADGGGYTLRWTSGDLKVEAPGPMQMVLEKTYASLMTTPLLIAVSADGSVERVLNLAEFRTIARKALAGLAGQMDAQMASLPAEQRSTLNRMFAALIEQQNKMTDSAFEDSLLDGPRLLLPGLGPLVPGQPLTATVEEPSPLGNGNIGFLTQVELSRYDPGKSAEIRVSGTANADDALRVTRAFLQPMLDAITDPAKRQAAEAEFARLGAMTISEEAIIGIGLPQGLSTRISHEKRISVPGQPSRLDTRSYVRLP